MQSALVWNSWQTNKIEMRIVCVAWHEASFNQAKIMKVKVFQIIILATNMMMKQAIRVDKIPPPLYPYHRSTVCLRVLPSDVAYP